MAYPSFNSGWPGAGGASQTDSYVDLFKTAYADTIRLKTQNMDSVLSDTCVPEVLMGDPLVLDSYKSVSLHQRGRGQQYGVASTSVSGDTTGGLDSTGTALNDQPAFAADGDLGNIAYKVTGNERRELKPQFWEFAELFDPRDERGLMRAIQPDGTYVMNVAAAFNRKKDNVIIDAFRGPTTLYTNNAASSALTADAVAGAGDIYLQAFRKDVDVAYGGDGSSGKVPVGADNGSTDIVTGSAAGNAIVGTIGKLIEDDHAGESGCQQIVVASQNLLGTTTASSRLHLAKILKGLEVMQTNGIPSGTKVYCAISPAGVSELMAEAQYTSADFNALRPLQSGQPVDFLGVEFRVCPEITSQSVISTYNATDNDLTIATGGHYAYLYTDQAMIFGMGNDMSVRFDEIPERGYSLQCYHEFSLGAIRMDPKQMVIIPNHA